MNNEGSPRVTASILVVDDTPANLQLLGGLLRELGFAVRLANSGAAALQAARLLPPDMILLDVRMPRMDGYEVCVRLKADERLKRIPVIFISALGETEDKLKAFQAGGVDYVTKPFHVEEVEARVRAHLENHRLRQEIEGHNARLERVVQERTRQLAESNARLAQLDRAKTDFLTVIAHELRSPLSVLLGVTELTFAEFPDHPQFIAYQKMFEESRQRLLRLIDDALLLSSMQVDDTRFSNQAVSMDELLAAATTDAQAAAEQQRVHVAICSPCRAQVRGDRFFLTKALTYLLRTGIKFSKPGRKLMLGLDLNPDDVSLVIKADGYGVPEEELARFFDVLAIGKSLVPEGDLGLSPAVAAQIIKLMGGQVRITNVLPHGVRMEVSLPRYHPAAGADCAPAGSKATKPPSELGCAKAGRNALPGLAGAPQQPPANDAPGGAGADSGKRSRPALRGRLPKPGPDPRLRGRVDREDGARIRPGGAAGDRRRRGQPVSADQDHLG